MPNYHLERLSRENYISSLETIEDPRTLRFANMSLTWWDKQFGWYTQGCIALTDDESTHLSYIFFKIDRYKEYITVHNIFTQYSMRRNGYAHELLKMVFDFAITENVKRFKLTSISNSLDFYLSMGFTYWGVNSVGDYYCDLPMPSSGLDGVESMTESSDTATLIGKKFETIHAKVIDNETNLSDSKTVTYKNDVAKMGESYMLNELMDIKN